MRRVGNITPIHTDFGNSPNDIIVAEYDVPIRNVRKTLFYKYGQLAIPKWALIPAGIIGVGALMTFGAIILNAILSQSISSATYSQTCSKTIKCKTEFGLICGSKSKCTCSSTQYWYEGNCVTQPTRGNKCNQTTECRTDLGLICASLDGECNCPNYTKAHTCDCPSTSYWTGSACTARSSYFGSCSVVDTNYQCLSNLYCNGTRCICSPNTQYWNLTGQSCFSIDTYLEACDSNTSYSCNSAVSLYCLPSGAGSRCPLTSSSGSSACDCLNGTYWTGGSCVSTKTYNSACYWDCECDQTVGLSCLNYTCSCATKQYWSSGVGRCMPQFNYSQSTCNSTSECDSSQGLTCAISSSNCNCPTLSASGMCDCLSTQYYDTNTSTCQIRKLYGEFCTADYMCDSSTGLFCQLSLSTATNCSCPTASQLNMCDCNTTSYWNGIACTPRLGINASCSFEYQCAAGYTCIVNQTDLGIFSDVCRCPLGQYYENTTGCIGSRNYTVTCEGSYQCYELAPLSCRYNDTGLSCLDTSVYSLPACDCSDGYYYNFATATCVARRTRLTPCNETCECTSPYECVSNLCNCINFYSSLNQSCVDNLRYGDNCTSDSECEATPGLSMSCVNGYCGCNSTGAWNGSICIFEPNFRDTCTSNSNCAGGLICRDIKCAGGDRCSCDSTSFYSFSLKTCISCTGSEVSDPTFVRYVINYPTADLCVAVRDKGSSSSNSISFDTAETTCAGFPSYSTGLTPNLLSIHNNTELTCLARILRDANNQNKCDRDNYYYIGYNRANRTFFDGTLYSSAFSSPSVTTSQCITYCHTGDSTARLNADVCTGSNGGRNYGAICDYQIT